MCCANSIATVTFHRKIAFADRSLAIAAEANGEVCSLGVIPNCLPAIRKLVAKLGPTKQLKACYEAGPTGYVLYWQLTQLGVSCEVIAPS
jgi:hypothetical protein